MTIDIDKISLTTVQGYLSLTSKFLIAAGAGLASQGYIKTAGAFGVLLILVGAAQAVIGQNQQDATKPVDSEGKPVASSEVPVAK